MKSFARSIFLGIIFGIYFSLYFLSFNGEVYFSQIIVNTAFGIYEISYDGIIELTINCFPILIFLIAFGTDIYNHFCTASVYYFTRCKSRSKWYLKEISILLAKTIIYVSIIPLACMAVAFIKNKVIIDTESVLLYLYYVVIYTLFLFGMVLFINVLSIKFGTIKSYAIVIFTFMFFIMLLSLWIEVFPLQEGNNVSRLMVCANGELLKYNLFAHLVLYWHSSFIETLNAKINLYGINFDLNTSVMVAFVFFAISIVIGYTIIKELDFIRVNNELEN